MCLKSRPEWFFYLHSYLQSDPFIAFIAKHRKDIIPIKYKKTDLISKTKCNITCIVMVNRDLFLELLLPLSLSFLELDFKFSAM